MNISEELSAFLRCGKLTSYPSKRRKKLIALLWLSEHISPKETYSEREFNALLNKLHSFQDPATLRRDLYDFGFVNRSPDGSTYSLNPQHPTLDSPEEKCNESTSSTPESHSDQDLKDAAEFRDMIHTEALRRVQGIRPHIKIVVDRYSAGEYFQQVWDYPDAWYTVVAIPKECKSREALIDTIVRDTLRSNW